MVRFGARLRDAETADNPSGTNRIRTMKPNIHPKYYVTEVTCGCGAAFVTRSTKPTIKVEICSECHPFYTGRQKFVDTAGRVEKFTRKYNWGLEEAEAAVEEKPVKAAKKSTKAKSSAKKKSKAVGLKDLTAKSTADAGEEKAAPAEAKQKADDAEAKAEEATGAKANS